MARHSRRHRKQRGGDLAGNPPSAWGWGLGTMGNGWTQFMNSLTLQPGQNIASASSNDIVPVGRPNANDPNIPKVGGKRRRHRHRRTSKRGGNVGAVLSQAAVPGILLAAQQSYGRTRKHRRH